VSLEVNPEGGAELVATLRAEDVRDPEAGDLQRRLDDAADSITDGILAALGSPDRSPAQARQVDAVTIRIVHRVTLAEITVPLAADGTVELWV
jgi:hypothetical protein